MFSLDERGGALNADPLFEAAVARLREQGFDVGLPVRSGGSDSGHDLALSRSGMSQTFEVEVRPAFTYSTLESVRRRSAAPFLITRHMPRGVARACRELHLPYADGAGNMFVEWPGLVVDIEGRKPEPGSTSPAEGPRTLRSFQPGGLKVILGLLSDPHLADQSLRRIAVSTGVSLGTAQHVIKELTYLDYVAETQDGRSLRHGKQLFDRWVDNYVQHRGVGPALGRYRIDDPARAIQDPLFESSDPPGYLGGESAVALLDSFLRPSTVLVYMPTLSAELLGGWRAHRSTNEPNLEVREKFWQGTLGAREPFVPSPLVFADLVASGDPRQIDAASHFRVRDERLQYLDRS